MTPTNRISFSLLFLAATATLAGCGVAVEPIGTSAPVSSLALGGSVHGGQQPVIGASVKLMVPGTSGYGSAPAVLAQTTTLAGGSFTLPAYTCPANSGDVYLLATGGNSGSGTNAVFAEAALLGPCSSLTPATFISVSEATTIAAAYALAPFATVTAAATNIGAPATNLQGLTNAFAAANNLAPFPSGFANAANAIPGVVLPQAEVNTLADILAACANTSGSTVGTAACGKLFTAATPASGIVPVDTFQAALNIALNPGLNVAALYALSSASGPFQPTLTAAPNDFALGIQYTGGGITGSYGTNGIAIDTLGNAWVVVGNTANVHQLTEISPAGVFLSGTTGYGATTLSGPQGIAIDASNNIYITDINLNKIFKFASNGSLSATFAPASLSLPLGIVIDTDNTLWVANNGNAKISHVTAAGLEAAGSPFPASNNPFDIALNASGNWTADFNNGSGNNGYLTNNLNLGGAIGTTQFQVVGHAQGIALDRNGYAWYTTASSTGSTLGRENPAGGSNFTPIVLPSAFQALEVFLDGNNNVWLDGQTRTNYATPGGVVLYSNTGTLISPALGYTANNTIVPSGDVPEGIATDGSGNLWISGYVFDSSGNPLPNAFVTELIGIAGPTVTPIATAAKNNALATRP